MSDKYIEQIVACNPPKSSAFVKFALVVLCAISVLFLMIPYVGIFMMVGVIVATVLKFQNYDYEYEYTYMNGELDVDKIIMKSRRKKMESFDFKKVELVAPVDSQEALRLANNPYKTFDYTSNMPDAKVYVAYVMNNNATVRLMFEPNEELLNEINYIAPRKVVF